MAKRAKDKKEKKAKRTKKDKDAPKKHYSAYIFYHQERKNSLKKERPELDCEKYYEVTCKEWNV